MNFGGKFMAYAGWGIGLASLLIAIYAEFITKAEPKLEYDIVSSARFINNNETSANLTIFVDSVDIQKNHLNITAYNIKVENKGTEHIRYDDYDRGPFGIRVSNGKLLEPPVILESSTEHIKNLYPKQDSLVNDCFIIVPQLSLDVDEYYIMRIVVLHSEDAIPFFTPEGKIVGQKTISLQALRSPTPNFWTELIHGAWYVHLVRFFIYLFLLVILSVSFGFIVSSIGEKISKHKRQKIVNDLEKKKKLVQFVKEDYINHGENAIVRMNDLYKKSEADVTTQYTKSKGFINSTRAKEISNRKAIRFHRERYQRIKGMIDVGYLVLRENDVVVFNKEAKQTVHDIYTMLDNRDLLKKNYVRSSYFEHIVIDPSTGESVYL